MINLNDIKPIFITGVYRSGTTLLSRILNNHPELDITYDSVHYMRFSYDKFNPICEHQNYSKLVNEIHERVSKRWKVNFDKDFVLYSIKNLKKIDYSYIYNIIMSNFLKITSTSWGEKTNMCWREIPHFLEMFPSGKTILIIRDPRDILISYKNMTYEPGLRYLDSIFACLDSFHYVNYLQKNASTKNFHLVKYEELVTNPDETIKKLTSFLEIDFDPLMLDASKFSDKWNNPWEGNSSFDKSIQSISNKTIGRWKDKISRVDLFFLEIILMEQMINFGYTPSGVFPNIDEWEKLFLIINDEFIKERFTNWLQTGKGHQLYPSDPILNAYREMNLYDKNKS